MGEINLLTVFLGAAAFFVVGMIWYGLLFSKLWQRETGKPEPEEKSNAPLIFSLCFLFELLVAVVLAHQFAMTSPSPRAMMMISVGYALGIMVPAMGINYLFQRKSLTLFLIDSGHFLFGMAAMGGVFVAMR